MSENRDWEDLETLTDQERKVLRVRWGYMHTLAEVGALGVGRQGQPVDRNRVRQIERDALRKLRAAGYRPCLVTQTTYRFMPYQPGGAAVCLGVEELE